MKNKRKYQPGGGITNTPIITTPSKKNYKKFMKNQKKQKKREYKDKQEEFGKGKGSNYETPYRKFKDGGSIDSFNEFNKYLNRKKRY